MSLPLSEIPTTKKNQSKTTKAKTKAKVKKTYISTINDSACLIEPLYIQHLSSKLNSNPQEIQRLFYLKKCSEKEQHKAVHERKQEHEDQCQHNI